MDRQSGQDAAAPLPPPTTVASLLREAADELLSLDRGLLWTWAMLWRDPGRVVDGALRREQRVTRPLRYLLLVFAIASLPLLLFGTAAATTSAGMNWASLWDALRAADHGDRTFSFRVGHVVGSALGLATRDYPHLSLLAVAPLLALGLSWAFRAQRAGYAVALLAATYALAQLYPLAVAAKLLDSHGAGAWSQLPVALGIAWWPWFTRGVYRAGWLPSLWGSLAAPVFAGLGALLLLLVVAALTAALAVWL